LFTVPVEKEKPVSNTDELIANSKAYAEAFDKGDLPLPPALKVAVVACMDARRTRTGSSDSARATPTSSATPAAS
jgi:hypothetical protein